MRDNNMDASNTVIFLDYLPGQALNTSFSRPKHLQRSKYWTYTNR